METAHVLYPETMNSVQSKLFMWKSLIHEGALVTAKKLQTTAVPLSDVKELKKQIRELGRLLIKKTMGVKVLRDALEIARKKLSRAYPYQERILSDEENTLHISRSISTQGEIKERERYTPRPYDSQYLPLAIEGLLPLCTVISRENNQSPVNHKRIYRIMRINQLLLSKHARRPTQSHTGTLTTLKSNMRCCSDVFDIVCCDGYST